MRFAGLILTLLQKSDPLDVVGAVELSRATLRMMHQNPWWPVGYCVISFRAAAEVLYAALTSIKLPLRALDIDIMGRRRLRHHE